MERYASIRPDAWDNIRVSGAFVRRQENARSTFKYQPVSSVNPMNNAQGLTKPRPITEFIASDYTSDIMREFDRTFNLSNELIVRKYVLSLNPKKKSTQSEIAKRKVDYLLSLEDFNLCRNCGEAIKVRKVVVGNSPEMAKHREPSVGKIQLSSRENGMTMTVAEIPYHWEVTYCERKNGLICKEVQKHERINSKCECMYNQVRKLEKKANRERKPRLL